MPELLVPGDAAPWFHAPALGGNPKYAFNSVGGRWVLLFFMGSGADGRAHVALDLLNSHRSLFDDHSACFFGVSCDPDDAREGRIAPDTPGIRWLLDYDGAVSSAYGAIAGDRSGYRPHWLLLDPLLRVHARASLENGDKLLDELRQRVGATTADQPGAPVLIVPNVFTRTTCEKLIRLHEDGGAEESGFMREENGKTVRRFDPGHKRRRDHVITDEPLIASLNSRIGRVLRPMIRRVFQFEATRIERWIVSCYDADDGGHFRAHRDNTTPGTAHRKFACSINLNSEEYDGGDLHFPEFGERGYRPPTGGALIFSCALLHRVEPVTRGKRYAFLPFFYDEEGARIRERNLGSVDMAGLMPTPTLFDTEQQG